MLARMQDTDLFTTQLAGPCRSLRRAWKLGVDETRGLGGWRWSNRPAERVRKALADIVPGAAADRQFARRNASIGGLESAVARAVAGHGPARRSTWTAWWTVHCDAAGPVGRRLSSPCICFRPRPNPGLAVYSCSWGRPL